ncbi:acyl-CoA dehydrogenase family protein [Salibacter sp.]|uniref:acyl-CoA dehydrogenase family protein n=1 Tax=Salibacter sp. TaxID=2010995 RepID=UPI0028704DA0|nr:acyl-CoA dehydrogenase family protein [Salibacter sp.]MDR9487755.1 acyl-CoA dehydrogenase family protein [Salibacter sp.]
MSDNKNKSVLMGGEFLIRESDAKDVFIPEEFDEEQLMIAQTCKDFVDKEVTPNLDRIDALEEGLMSSILDKAGELGMLGISVPEQYGGFGKNFVTSMLSSEATGAGHSFSVSYSAHTGIGTLPILYYGTEEQKEKYLPKLASGEWKGAYCLTEPGSGSDANSAKTKAELTDDGKHYVIKGQKMWITNGGFADVFTVFARIGDDENLSAFIVMADTDGVSLNPEEKKMGIKGSSTRQVFFNDVKIPKDNLLGKQNEGFKIALNILNIGRIKLAAAVLGGCKGTISQATNYANERNQFGRPISKYGAIKDKIAKMAIKTYASESATYRASQNIEDHIKYLHEKEGMDKAKADLKGIEQYAVECAMMKVHGSETLDFVVDEGVQIYGGMGYSAESPVERSYRDARINRIFEGTNEINRMLTVDMMLKKGMKGELDLMGPAKKVGEELMSIPDFDNDDSGLFGSEKRYIKNFKKAVLMVAGSAAQKFMMELAKEQEILLNIADMLTETYVAESVLLRVEKLAGMKGEEETKLQQNMVRAYIYEAAEKIGKCGREALMSYAEGDELRMQMMGIKRFTKIEPFNIKQTRREVAEAIIKENKYIF